MNPTRPLRTALLTNALFSLSCALTMLLAPIRVSDLLGIRAHPIIPLIGLGLVIFAADLIHQATRTRMVFWRALYASIADFLWVLGTIAGVLLFPGLLSASGLLVVSAVAGVVLVFGTWQLWAIRQAYGTDHIEVNRHCIRTR